ncbi:nucleotide-binding protein [Vulcanisaeta thermophila]|uniref:nucleotide-binding protein n=1 Tax=Vulcanisaeta thermophila TaxID=867917 RepID=UPI000853507E|nr:ParA family protein [Vulcanisaeta thermophila]
METILVTSGTKGGTGKTTLTINLAVILSYELRKDAQYPVALVDMGIDSGTATLLLLGDVNTQVQYTLGDYFMGRVPDPLSVLYVKTWQVGNDVFKLVFTASIRQGINEVVRIDRYLLKGLMNAISAVTPIYVFIDTPALGLSYEVLIDLLELSNHVILVSVPDHSSLRAVANVVNLMREFKVENRLLKPVLNMLNTKYPVDPVTNTPWTQLLREVTGMEPHVIPYDELFPIARQAFEIESLKLSFMESPALSSIFNYVDYLLSTTYKTTNQTK